MSNTIQSKDLATTPLSSTDILAIVQGGVLKRTTLADLPDATLISNSNGLAIRFGNGIQICWTLTAITETGVDITTAFAGGFRNLSDSAGTWTFPAAFVDSNYFFIARPSGEENLIAQYVNLSVSAAYIRAFRVTSATVDTAWKAVAIGKWE